MPVGSVLSAEVAEHDRIDQSSTFNKFQCFAAGLNDEHQQELLIHSILTEAW
jgi:hypothetical protein